MFGRGQRCAPFDAPEDDGLTAERAARDRAIDVGHDGEATFHETRIDDLLHLRRLRERRLTAVFGCDNDAALSLTYRIDCIERGQADPGEAR